eukprot:jgi/Bigna1/85552/estExt_fgenesh1_pg.C_40360
MAASIQGLLRRRVLSFMMIIMAWSTAAEVPIMEPDSSVIHPLIEGTSTDKMVPVQYTVHSSIDVMPGYAKPVYVDSKGGDEMPKMNFREKLTEHNNIAITPEPIPDPNKVHPIISTKTNVDIMTPIGETKKSSLRTQKGFVAPVYIDSVPESKVAMPPQ